MSKAHDDALAIHQRATDAFERIRANDTLSPVGKQRAMAPHLLKAKQDIADLAWRANANRELRIKDLKRTTFGVAGSDPASVMLHRDAVGRAAAITDQANAQYQMQRALDAGDDVMAKCIAESASERGWIQTLQAYVDHRPEVGEALQELQALQPSVESNFADAMYLRAPVPTELQRMSDGQLEDLAAQRSEPAPEARPAAPVGGGYV